MANKIKFKQTVMCGYDIHGCNSHMEIFVGEPTNEPCEDCGCTEDCYKVVYEIFVDEED